MGKLGRTICDFDRNKTTAIHEVPASALGSAPSRPLDGCLAALLAIQVFAESCGLRHRRVILGTNVLDGITFALHLAWALANALDTTTCRGTAIFCVTVRAVFICQRKCRRVMFSENFNGQ